VAEVPATFDPLPWLTDERLIVLAGPGGVGKTTLAAAIGIAAARQGRRVLVLTVDPARRLAQALGIEGATESPVPVPVPRLPRGASLRALQIDPKSTFERLLPLIATKEAVDRIHANRRYSGLVDSLPGVLEYMGVEALAEHANDPSIDLIVLDTPPAARGLDFLSAPERMVQLLSNDALRWFLRGDSLLSRALSGASRGAAALLRLADKALGFGFLSDLADFFRVFDGLYDGFQERSATIAAQLARGKFFVVSSPDAAPLVTAAGIAAAFARRGVETALLLNRIPRRGAPWKLPEELRDLPALGLVEADGAAAELPFLLSERLTASQPTSATRS
jgi:anion-transporting  ArsA/GET3 family ATPase